MVRVVPRSGAARPDNPNTTPVDATSQATALLNTGGLNTKALSSTPSSCQPAAPA